MIKWRTVLACLSGSRLNTDNHNASISHVPFLKSFVMHPPCSRCAIHLFAIPYTINLSCFNIPFLLQNILVFVSSNIGSILKNKPNNRLHWNSPYKLHQYCFHQAWRCHWSEHEDLYGRRHWPNRRPYIQGLNLMFFTCSIDMNGILRSANVQTLISLGSRLLTIRSS